MRVAAANNVLSVAVKPPAFSGFSAIQKYRIEGVGATAGPTLSLTSAGTPVAGGLVSAHAQLARQRAPGPALQQLLACSTLTHQPALLLGRVQLRFDFPAGAYPMGST